MELYILRHGEAGQRSATPSKDGVRSLTFSGKKEIEEISKVLDGIESNFDKIISSPLKRANETASIVAKELKLINKLENWDELKPEGKRDEFYRRLSRLSRDSIVLLVGHEPYLSSLISDLISGSDGASILLKKGGIARVRVSQFAPKSHGQLRWLLTPRQLKKMA